MNAAHAAAEWQQRTQQVNTTYHSHHAEWTHSTAQSYTTTW